MHRSERLSCCSINSSSSNHKNCSIVLRLSVLCIDHHLSADRRRGLSVCPVAVSSAVWASFVVKSARCCLETSSFSLTPPPHWCTCGPGIRMRVTSLPSTGRRRLQRSSWATRRYLGTLTSFLAPTAAPCLQTAAWTWQTCSSAQDRPRSSGFLTLGRDSVS